MRGLRFPLVLGSFVIVVLVQSAAPACAAWPHDPNVNLPLCTATNEQSSPTIVSDGAGGAIVTWEDCRSGSYDIYAQRVDAAGVAQWTANGVALCAAAGWQYSPKIVSDGAGGAIVTWYDLRSGSSHDIYAQWVNAAGVVQWTANGVALCTATGNQQHPTIASDESGGAIVTWEDSRSGNLDIYAQRVNAAGAVQWTANGVALCNAAETQFRPTIVADGLGGVIVAWNDGRSVSSYDIYAQRVNAAGAVQWTANGVALCTATNGQDSPTIASDGAGGAIVAWQDSRSGNEDIYAQRVSATGGAQWTANGVALCTATALQESPRIASDGSNGAIVTWYDYRSGNYDIYAQRVSAGGMAQWTANGVPLCTATGQQENPAIASDGSGGAIVTWRDNRSGNYDIYAQKVSAAGGARWTADGVALCTATGEQFQPTIVSDGGAPGAAGTGAIVTWHDYRSGSSYQDIYAQRIERYGYLGTPEPEIASVKDVANDQGGKVKVSWDASWLDMAGDANLAEYDVLRSVPTSLVAASLARGGRMVSVEQAVTGLRAGDIVAQSAGAESYYWEYLATVTAVRYLTGYSYLAATAGDSVPGSNPYTAFMVVGRNWSCSMFWLSAPDSGYSVDDLAPGMPAAFSGQYASGTARLHWMPNGETDLNGYRLYRGTTAGFVPGPGNRVAEPADTGYVDVAGAPYHYKLSAVDVHGNESGHVLLQPSGTADVPGGAPTALSLSLGSANPARGSAVLRWALPAEAPARLVVYDLAGRVVRELAAGRAGAGEHRTAWDGRDGTGALVGAGLYLVRLEAAGRVLSVRIALVR